jgi:hypothetical protein
VIGTDCKGSCKSNYHVITATIVHRRTENTIAYKTLHRRTKQILQQEHTFELGLTQVLRKRGHFLLHQLHLCGRTLNLIYSAPLPYPSFYHHKSALYRFPPIKISSFVFTTNLKYHSPLQLITQAVLTFHKTPTMLLGMKHKQFLPFIRHPPCY